MKYNILLAVMLVGIFSVMFMPISTAEEAIHLGVDPTDGSYCNGEPKSAWKHTRVVPGNPLDVNENGYVCINMHSGKVHDDRLPKK